MLDRRHILTAGLTAFASAASFGLSSRGAHAQAGVAKATAFMQQMGDRLVAIVNSAVSTAEKRRQLTQILEAAVDVDSVARFCLGRFWRTSTPDQQKRFVTAFHDVLVTNITAKLGEYQGVKLTVEKARMQDEEAIVSSIVERPNNPQTTVDWVIEDPASNPRVVDVLAEGTSLRLTQRQDYASYLTRNNNSVDALINAMKQQTAQNG